MQSHGIMNLLSFMSSMSKNPVLAFVGLQVSPCAIDRHFQPVHMLFSSVSSLRLCSDILPQMFFLASHPRPRWPVIALFALAMELLRHHPEPVGSRVVVRDNKFYKEPSVKRRLRKHRRSNTTC